MHGRRTFRRKKQNVTNMSVAQGIQVYERGKVRKVTGPDLGGDL